MNQSPDARRDGSLELVRQLVARLRTHDAPSSSQSLQQLDADHKAAQTADLRTDTELKRRYAHWFVLVLIGQLVVMNLVFALVGVGVLNFADYALHLYMGGTLAEVFGVVFIITRYLFSKR